MRRQQVAVGVSPWSRVAIRVEPRRRRQHLPSGASPKAAEASEGRACGRDARAPGGARPFPATNPAPSRILQKALLNMDIQDAQDHQDETLLHRKRTPSMIRSVCEVILMGLGANSRILVEEKAMP